MNDPIDRQAAIDAIYHHFPDKTREECAMVLHEVPSAQPDADLIHLQKEQAYMQGWEDGRGAIVRCKMSDAWDSLSKVYNMNIPDEAKSIIGDVMLSLEQPERTGKWIDCVTSEHWKCDRCGERAPIFWDGENMSYVEWLSGFCPNCGADMREPE